MLDFLTKRGLLNDGLVSLSPKQIERYNRCLVRADIPPTRRKKVRVDGIGWSPEIAEEQKNPLYLTKGVVNPLAIIVDPEQHRKPSFAPAFSWLRDATDFYFNGNHRKIFDVLLTHAIQIDWDNGLSELSDPRDLRLLTEVIARPDTGTLASGARKQVELITRFNQGLSCLDPKLQNEIIINRRDVGDLRNRQVLLEPVAYDQFSDFHTVAYNGAAVLRNVNGDDLLVLEDQSVYEQVRQHDGIGGRILYLYDKEGEPFRLLTQAGWFTIPIDIFRNDHRHLERMKDILLGMQFSDATDSSWTEMSVAKRRGMLSKKGNDEKSRLYLELERYAAAIKSKAKDLPEPSHELWYYLAVPSTQIPRQTRDVLMFLLTRKEPRRLLDLYTTDKNRFVVEYEKWGKQKQLWAAEYLAAHYQKRMNNRAPEAQT